MNLHVDLIYPTEQRSASPVSLKGVGRIFLILVLSAVGLVVARNLIAIGGLKSRLAAQDRQWTEVAPKKLLAAKLIKEASENLEILDELNGWKNSRLEWAQQLLTLARIIPEQVQIKSLSVQHEFQVVKGEKVGRAYSLGMAGRCSSEGAEMHVASFKSEMAKAPGLGPLEEVNVPTFGEDPKKREDRIFTVKCPFLVRSF